MLRDFTHTHSELVIETLSRFQLTLPKGNIALMRFEALSPDSFVWQFLIDNETYYLYAEDYIPGLEHVKSALTSYIGDDQWQLVKVKQQIKYETSGPIRSTSVYKVPKDVNEMLKYAVDSGYDFVFLAHAGKRPND